MKYKVVKVIWEDCSSTGRWHSIEEANKWFDDGAHYTCEDVGFLIRSNEKEICLATRLGADGSLGCLSRIPKKWVIKILKYGNK